MAKSPSDFRPISLLSVLSKVLERHFHMLISDHLAEHHSLSNCQWGFQPKKSALSTLISTTHDWLQQLEAGNETGTIFFDFETVPTLKYLGLLLSSDLSLREYAPEQTKFYPSYTVDFTRTLTMQETLLQLYVSIVRPHMEYTAPVWDQHVRQIRI